ncbi:cysteine desulfurase [Clostridia bacterium]|nr:cysteine desulfurase [Clostridia bacterium]
MEIYFDHAATTVVSEQAVKRVWEVMEKDYGNPSSLHQKGLEAEAYLKKSRESIAKALKVLPQEVYFTSGGTESNNLSLIGLARAKKRQGKHIVVSSIEHASVIQAAKYLENEGFNVSYLPVSSKGMVEIDTLQAALTKDTILVSIMHVNNELGSIQNIKKLCACVKTFHSQIVFHTDAVQSFGKIEIFPKLWGIDILSLSGHKLGAPKGVGVIFIREGVRLVPLIYGGGHEQGLRSGTENVPGIAGLWGAVEEVFSDFDGRYKKVLDLKQYAMECLKEIEKVVIHSDLKDYSPYVLNISCIGVRSEVLLHALAEKGIYVSAASACSSHGKKGNTVLQNIKLPQKEIDSAIRLSFSIGNTKEEVDYFTQQCKAILLKLRRFQ